MRKELQKKSISTHECFWMSLFLIEDLYLSYEYV